MSNTERPLDNMVTNGGFTRIFKSITCVGDSLSSGEFESLKEDGTKGYYDMFEYSWGQIIGRTIGDCMMNLPVLYWASRQSDDPRFRLIAMKHADTAMRAFIREDGSSNHIVAFNPETGEVESTPGGQGCESGSSWSRGQAWALYGFALSFLHTGKQDYLDTAKRVANYFISQITDDYIPRCDFRQPAEPVIKDNAAGAIAASGLLLLSKLVKENEAEPYFQTAMKLLRAMEAECINWNHDDPALLTKCTSAYHDVNGRHITMDYADYFFIEAINMLHGQELLFWYPDQTAAKPTEKE